MFPETSEEWNNSYAKMAYPITGYLIPGPTQLNQSNLELEYKLSKMFMALAIKFPYTPFDF